MTEDFDRTDSEDGPEDPAGGVLVAPSRREIVRARALAGVAIGLTAMIGLAGWTPGTSITSITA